MCCGTTEKNSFAPGPHITPHTRLYSAYINISFTRFVRGLCADSIPTPSACCKSGLFRTARADCLLVAAAVLFISAKSRGLVAHVTVLYLVLLLDTGLVRLRSGLDAHAARSGRQGAPVIDSVAEVCKDRLAGLCSGLHRFRVCAARGSE